MGFFESIGKAAMDYARAVAAAHSKDDIIANRLWYILASAGFKMTKSSTTNGEIHRAVFSSKTGHIIEAEVRGPGRVSGISAVGLPGRLFGITTMCQIELKIIPPSLGMWERLLRKGVGRFSYIINASDYIDNELKITNQKGLDAMLKQFIQPLLATKGKGLQRCAICSTALQTAYSCVKCKKILCFNHAKGAKGKIYCYEHGHVEY